MYETVKAMKCFNKKNELQNSLQIFQKGILMSITSLKLLRTKMYEKFGFTYILTHRLNQDCLENFFCQVRGRTGSNDHPTPVDCLQRIKVIMLGKNPGVALHLHSNTVERDPEEYVSAMFMEALSDGNSKKTQCEATKQSPTNPGNDDSNNWSVEFLEDLSIENDQMSDEHFSDDSNDWPVEFLEDPSMEHDQMYAQYYLGVSESVVSVSVGVSLWNSLKNFRMISMIV